MTGRMAQDEGVRIAYVPRASSLPETELSALAACYRFILDCHVKKKGAHAGVLDYGTKVQGDSADAPIVPERP